MSYQQCTRFRTTLNFDRENIWNGSSNRDKRKTALLTTIFPTFDENNLVNFGPLPKMTLTFELNKSTCSCKTSSTCAAVHRVNELFAISRSGEKSENPVV